MMDFAALTRWRVIFRCTKVLDEMVDHYVIKSTLSQKLHGAGISMQLDPLGPVEKVAPESPTWSSVGRHFPAIWLKEASGQEKAFVGLS